MKKFIIQALPLVCFSLLFLDLDSKNISDADANCIWKAWFKSPQNNSSYELGKPVYVRVDVTKKEDIEYMELYVDDKYVRRESKHPYEWCRGSGSSDRLLRNLKSGKHQLKCRFKDKCGKFHEIYSTINVKAGNGESAHNSCPYKVWFKYPQHGKYYPVGSDVYVHLDATKHTNIKYCELYLNGKLVRKEMQHPYEWAKGQGSSDSQLRNLKGGTKKLKCRVYDQCGKYKDYFCTFYVQGNGQQSDPSTEENAQQDCQYHLIFKPDAFKNIFEGDDFYVSPDVNDRSKIKYIALYLDGKFVRRENSAPYEWCKGSGNHDALLRNMKLGKHTLKFRTYNVCGEQKDFDVDITVKKNPLGSDQLPGETAQNDCDYKFELKSSLKSVVEGDDVYVSCAIDDRSKVKYIALYLDGKLVRRENSAPYEWCKGQGNNDALLRNIGPGKHRLRFRVYDVCDKYKDFEPTFYARSNSQGSDPAPGETAQTDCLYKIKFKTPGKYSSITEGDDVYVSMDVDNYRKIKYCELSINGRLVRRENSFPYEWGKGRGNSDALLRNIKRGNHVLSCRVLDQCGEYKDLWISISVKSKQPGSDPSPEETAQNDCDYQFRLVGVGAHDRYNEGDDIHVSTIVGNRSKIKYCELYVNGKLVRRENRHPYEWGNGNGNGDAALRNVKYGNYKVKCQVYDVCGTSKDYYGTIRVRKSPGDQAGGGQGNGQPGTNGSNGHSSNDCKYKSWYKYPKKQWRL